MKRILGPALATLTLAACGGWDTPPRAIATPSTAAASTDCGTFDLPQGESLPDSAVRCLVEAVRAGRPARLQVTRPTVEGDPIPVTYTAGTDGRVEVITDSRQDSFGTPIITRETCTGPILASQLEFAECSEPTPVGK
jgi:hypothetical protein